MVERCEPTLIKFAEGEWVRGVLVSIERIDVDKKPVARYTVRDLDTGEYSSFLGTHQINAKIRRSDIGHAVEVRYEGTDPSIVRNGNAMRRFKVLISDRPVTPEESAAAMDELEMEMQITDDDIGF